MRALIALTLIALSLPAHAQDGYEVLDGLFGSASDPAASCAANPHELDVIDNRPHLARTWKSPVTGSAGSSRLREVFDVEAFDGTAMILSE